MAVGLFAHCFAGKLVGERVRSRFETGAAAGAWRVRSAARSAMGRVTREVGSDRSLVCFRAEFMVSLKWFPNWASFVSFFLFFFHLL